jgi:F0F1-type ATP synthase assembly protein I
VVHQGSYLDSAVCDRLSGVIVEVSCESAPERGPLSFAVAVELRTLMNKEDPGKKSTLLQLAEYSQLAFIFPAATVAGLLIGYGLDHWLHTKHLYLVGLIVGIVAGFVELIRTVMSSEKE